ncbi:hypothetical protein DFJ73DRAFT_168744 [Zopfochytrium polystomum]|nr:hypothetical protein DFJ73DRAFT_168744 [Zopfochytrium polystomum]
MICQPIPPHPLTVPDLCGTLVCFVPACLSVRALWSWSFFFLCFRCRFCVRSLHYWSSPASVFSFPSSPATCFSPSRATFPSNSWSPALLSFNGLALTWSVQSARSCLLLPCVSSTSWILSCHLRIFSALLSYSWFHLCWIVWGHGGVFSSFGCWVAYLCDACLVVLSHFFFSLLSLCVFACLRVCVSACFCCASASVCVCLRLFVFGRSSPSPLDVGGAGHRGLVPCAAAAEPPNEGGKTDWKK